MKPYLLRPFIFTTLILLIPLIAMQFTSEVNWDAFDFIVIGTLLFGAGLVYEYIASKGGTTRYRAGIGLAIVTAVLLVWVNGAVGIIGSEGQAVNLLYGGVLAIGLIGTAISRLKAPGMANAMFVTAAAQFLVPIIAVVMFSNISWGAAGIARTFVLNGFFVLMWLGSGLLFIQSLKE